ncbi:MAG: transposase [Spirochaetia bacterium]|nr:transposase [Spirochaetia bacterium]
MNGSKQKSYTHEQRLAYLKEFDESGKSLREYCKDKDINYWTIHDWKRKRNQKTDMFSEKVEKTSFIQLKPGKKSQKISQKTQADQSSRSIVLHRGAWRMEVPQEANPAQIEKLIKILEAVHGI